MCGRADCAVKSQQRLRSLPFGKLIANLQRLDIQSAQADGSTELAEVFATVGAVSTAAAAALTDRQFLSILNCN
jgi:hypothetical protein